MVPSGGSSRASAEPSTATPVREQTRGTPAIGGETPE